MLDRVPSIPHKPVMVGKRIVRTVEMQDFLEHTNSEP